ncbi:MAG: penicillin-binding protein [Candidatus Dojkabacteria bacterium]
MGYTTKVRLGGRSKNRKGKKSNRNFASAKWQRSSRSGRKKRGKASKLKKEKIRKILYTSGAVILIVVFIGLLFGLSYVQSITEDLPSPDKPFGQKSAASEIYDRNGKLLYRVFGEENRDPVDIDKVPELLKWAFLAAEDIDFYSHPGFDVSALIRCSFVFVREGVAACGGSTITQQLIKQTALTDERKLERKLKEIILALQIERERGKDEILEMYLTVAPEGSNIYGVTSAADVYFGKNMHKLNLAEMAIIAAIPQDPTRLSPTLSANPEESQAQVKIRQQYVLDQMERYKDLINERVREQSDGEMDEDILTQEMIDEAREYELEYRKPIINIKAPHFVFYAQKLLQERGYDQGEPFTLEDIETGGYKITTTLDLDYQNIAQEQVKKGVRDYGSNYGAANAALISLDPKNGEILAMVGSKDYFGEPTPKGCTLGLNCRFEPSVNVTDTLQSIGSSMKPMVYYKSIMDGTINAGSPIPDIPIKIGNYTPKNYEGGFLGIRDVRFMLSQSRNIPAIYLVDWMGVSEFIKEMHEWGYTTLDNPAGYGPSIAVGGSDVKLIDHAQAYGVFANKGKYTQHEVILKIEDREGNIVFEYEPKSKKVADERGVFIVNDILNGRKGGPGDSWDGRDIAGKTGTAEDQKETIFATYTPEIVAVGWLGNNDNTPMRYGASGFMSARPWVAEYIRRIGGSIPKTPFPRPAGVAVAGSCSAEEGSSCSGVAGGDLGIAGIKTPSYVSVSTATVCTDQPRRLARDIDIQVGMAKTVTIKSYKMPNTRLQGFLDSWLRKNPKVGGVKPTKFCNVNRNPSGTQDPWAAVTSPTSGQVIGEAETAISVDVAFNAFSVSSDITQVEILFDGVPKDTATALPYSNTIDVGTLIAGAHSFSFVVSDSTGDSGTTVVPVEVMGLVSITGPGAVTGGDQITISVSHTGSPLDSVDMFVDGINAGTCDSTSCTWDVPPVGVKTYTIKVNGILNGFSKESNEITVNAS